MKTLAQLTTPLTVAEASAAIYAALATEGVNVTLWKAGAPTRTLVAGLAIILASLSQLQAAIAKMSFLALASGSWLTLVALYVYNVTRDPGSFATGSLTLTNAAGGVFSYAPYAATFSNGTKTYKNVDTISLGAFGTQTITIQATELGSGSSAGPATITNLVTPMPGVTASNAAALLGTDEENDATLRLRCGEKLGTLSPNGARDAYAFIARSAKFSSGVSAGVERIKTIADGTGGIDAYFATASGNLTGTVGNVTTPLGLVDYLLQTQVVPLDITLRSHTAIAQAIACTYELWVPDTMTETDAEIQALVDLGIANYLAARPIGGDIIPGGVAPGKVYKSALEDAIGAAIPGIAIRRIMTVPAADVSMTDVMYCPIATENTCTAIHRVVGALI